MMGTTRSLKTEDGRLVVIAGASRSGKTAWAVREFGSAARILVWDAEDQWSARPGFRRILSRRELFHAVQCDGPARLAFVPSGDLREAFDFFAACAFHWGRYHGPAVVIAEELADVTTMAKAPGHWGILLRRGLKRGLSIVAISQRWAECDKTAIGNASEFVLFRMSSADDVAYMARKTRVSAEMLEGLKPLEYVRYWVTGETERGRLTFGRKRAA